jgi:HK97 family phage portal protein
MKLPALADLLPWRKKAAEGAYRPGPYQLSDGWLSASAGRLMNWWQGGHSLQPYGSANAMVEACVSAYSQTVAMCPGDHWRTETNGGRVRVTNSALARILKKPNDYQSISDFLLNLTRRLYCNGEAFAVSIQNNRFETNELHLMQYGYPYIAEDGSVFYSLSGNEIAEKKFDFSLPIPARDVLHVRLHTPRHPLKGESPVLATALDLAMSGAALNQQIAFYLNAARPSFILETDEKLNKEQTRDLRNHWDAQTQGENAGRTPILTWGLKAKPISMSAQDGQLAEMLKMTDQNVALAFRIPLQVLGVGGTPFASTEALMASWKASGLGFALNHIEEAFGLLFGLKGQPDEYLEFNTNALMRSNFKELIEGLSKSVISGIHSSDEARNEIGFPKTPGGFGEMPRVQQQVVPLDWVENQPQLPSPTLALPPPDNSTEGANANKQRAVLAFRRSHDRHLAA